MTRSSDGLEIRRLPVTQLSREDFAPYGIVIGPESAESPNFNRAPGNLGFLWIQRELEFPRQAYLGALRYYNRAMRCAFLQRHPESTVVLLPMGGQASVIFVALDDGDGSPDLDSARAVVLDGRQGVIIHPGTWLRYAFPIGPWVDFAYITQRVDPATANSTDDTVRYLLDEMLGIVLDVDFVAPDGAEMGPGDSVAALPPKDPPYA